MLIFGARMFRCKRTVPRQDTTRTRSVTADGADPKALRPSPQTRESCHQPAHQTRHHLRHVDPTVSPQADDRWRLSAQKVPCRRRLRGCRPTPGDLSAPDRIRPMDQAISGQTRRAGIDTSNLTSSNADNDRWATLGLPIRYRLSQQRQVWLRWLIRSDSSSTDASSPGCFMSRRVAKLSAPQTIPGDYGPEQ